MLGIITRRIQHELGWEVNSRPASLPGLPSARRTVSVRTLPAILLTKAALSFILSVGARVPVKGRLFSITGKPLLLKGLRKTAQGTFDSGGGLSGKGIAHDLPSVD